MIYVHTLSFNLPSEVEEATRLLYDLNPGKGFKHIIVDLGFPLLFGADIPVNIEHAKVINTVKLKRIAEEYGSQYLKCENVGVSQNWNQVIEHIKLSDEDVLICADPDERPKTRGWINAIAGVLQNSPRIAACALVMPAQKQWLESHPSTHVKTSIHGYHVYLMNGTISMAQLGFSGRFLRAARGVPVPDRNAVYGYIESALTKMFARNNFKWCILQDYFVEHTECSTLYRAWKTDITSGEYTEEKQISFEQWLIKKSA